MSRLFRRYATLHFRYTITLTLLLLALLLLMLTPLQLLLFRATPLISLLSPFSF